MLSESVLPNKSQLIKVCKENYRLDHAKLQLSGIATHKDKVVMAIYIAEMLREAGKDAS